MQSFLALAAPVVGIGGAVGWAAALVIFDVRQRRLPDFLTVPAAGLALGWIGFTWQWHALWGLLWPVLYLAMAALSNGQGMGGGDIKLAVSLGVVSSAKKPDCLTMTAPRDTASMISAPPMPCPQHALWGLLCPVL